jgi:glycosyltransferase 2 family protein
MATGNSRYKQILILIAKIAISACVLGFVAYRTDLSEFTGLWPKVDPLKLPLALLFFAAMVFTNALRYRIMVLLFGVRLRTSESIKVVYLSLFFNNFGLANMGGDVYKMVYTAGTTGKRFNSIVLVFLERLLGLAALVVFVMVTASFTEVEGTDLILAISSLLALLLGAATIFIFSSTLQKPFAEALSGFTLAQKVFERLSEFPPLWRNGGRGLIITAFALSPLLHLVTCVFVWSLGMSLGMDEPFCAYLVYIPLVYLITALPISVAGLGVQELSFTAFFGPVHGLALALIFRISLILLTIPAPLLWPSGARKQSRL